MADRVRYLGVSDKITRREFLVEVGAFTLSLPFFSCSSRSVALDGKGSGNTEPLSAGSPKASDVIMRSLGIHPKNSGDPHDTMQALRNFHANRLEWTYIDDINFIQKVKQSGRLFGGTVSATSYIPVDRNSNWFEKVAIKDLNGKLIIAPWKRTWERSLWGCMNNPELEAGYIRYLKQYIDAGAQVMQRDEPEGNLLATSWGGCFCAFCVEGFRKHLKENFNSDELLRLGVSNITTFNYREYLREIGAPVGDAFAKWDGGELKRQFIEFQTEATISFHKRTRLAINRYANRSIPMSCNNGAVKHGPIEQLFDWWIGELRYRDATPETLYRIMTEAKKCGKQQVVTMPKKGDYNNLTDWVGLTRKTIAMAYACGGQCLVPWDIYMPNNAPRYFGLPSQYADLFAFVRANKMYLDGYRQIDALVSSSERKGQKSPHITAEKEICVTARTNPDDVQKPLVFHLIDWSSDPKPFSLWLDFDYFKIRRGSTFHLLVPELSLAIDDPITGPKGWRNHHRGPIALHGQSDNALAVPAIRPWGLLLVYANS